MSNDVRNKYAKKTYFGFAALITGIFASLALGANVGSSQLNISPETFSILNNITALSFCIITPLTFILGVLGYTRKNDSRSLSVIAIILGLIPFLVVLSQLVYSLTAR